MHLPARSDGAGPSVLICVPVPVSLGKGYSNFPLVRDSKGSTRLLTRPQEGILRSSKTTSLSHSLLCRNFQVSFLVSAPQEPACWGQGSWRPPCDFRQGWEADAGVRAAAAWGDCIEGRGRAGDMISMAGSTSAGRGQGGTRPGTLALGPQKDYRGASRHDVWPSAPPVPTPQNTGLCLTHVLGTQDPRHRHRVMSGCCGLVCPALGV